MSILCGLILSSKNLVQNSIWRNTSLLICRYIFQADPPGTFWYHSHSGTQRDDGLFGALIIREREEKLLEVQDQTGIQFADVPENHTLTIFDLQQSPSIEVYSRMQAHTPVASFFSFLPPQSDTDITNKPVDFGGTEGSPIPYWSGLINGRGRHPSIGYTGTRLSIFTITPSQVYRFRIIGVQASFTYLFSIDEHLMTILATDGSFVEPVTVEYLIISSGERYDVLVTGKELEELNEQNSFMIRARTLEPIPNADISEPLQYRTDHTVEAILHYNITPEPNSTQYSDIATHSKPVDDTCTSGEPCIALNCPFPSFPPSYNITCLHIHKLQLLYPLSDEDSPRVVPDQKIFLNFAFGGYDGSSTVNARNFKMPSSPLLLLNSTELEGIREEFFCQGLDDPSLCDNNLENDAIFSSSCLCSHIKTLSFNQSVQLVFSALGPNPENLIPYSSSHPIHLHGHHFQVVDVQFGSYDDTGRLSEGNTDINCGGSHLCTVPQWKNDKGFSVGKEGNVNASAPLKDTILIPAGGYAVVYIKTTNPGYWHLHCHVDPHLIEGMAVVLSEAIDELPPPPRAMHQCGSFTWSLDEYFNKFNGQTPLPSTTLVPSLSPTAVSSDCNDNKALLYTVVSMSTLLVVLLTALAVTTSCLCWLVCCKKEGATYKMMKNIQD